MNYNDWNKLTPEEKKTTSWKHHPHIRIAKLFSVLFIVLFFVFLLSVLHNRSVHVNRKPNALEAFTVSKAFVLDKLKQPATASFPKNSFTSTIDTARNSYQISSFVNSQDSSGKTVKTAWQIMLAYKGGDWSEKRSWAVTALKLEH